MENNISQFGKTVKQCLWGDRGRPILGAPYEEVTRGYRRLRKGILDSAKNLLRAKSRSRFSGSLEQYSSSIQWIKVASIEYIGYEQVYDIEVEGTHNFIANGIIAHNTYISSNVGIGTTSPAAILDMKGLLNSALTGTVGVTNLSATVSGTTTAFNTELAVGDSIKIGTETFTVSAIASATSLTLDSAFQGSTQSGLTAYRDSTLFSIQNGDAVNKITVTRSGKLGIGTTVPAQKLHVEGQCVTGDTLLTVIARRMPEASDEAISNSENEIAAPKESAFKQISAYGADVSYDIALSETAQIRFQNRLIELMLRLSPCYSSPFGGGQIANPKSKSATNDIPRGDQVIRKSGRRGTSSVSAHAIRILSFLPFKVICAFFRRYGTPPPETPFISRISSFADCLKPSALPSSRGIIVISAPESMYIAASILDLPDSKMTSATGLKTSPVIMEASLRYRNFIIGLKPIYPGFWLQRG